MEWSVLATFAGVLVAAFGAAWAIVREQSVMRQLERVSAVLKDLPCDDPGRDHLVVVRADLAKRLNEGYRAPRIWGLALLASALRIFGAIVIAVGYVYAFIGLNSLLPPTADLRGYRSADWLGLSVVFVVIGAATFLIAAAVVGKRSQLRRGWLSRHSRDSADRSSV